MDTDQQELTEILRESCAEYRADIALAAIIEVYDEQTRRVGVERDDAIDAALESFGK